MKKSHRMISSLAVAAASLCAVAGAQAQGAMSMYSPGNAYIGLSAGQSDFSLGNGTGAFGSESRGTAYSITGGSYFNSNLGLELGYTDFGNVDRAGGNTKANGFNMSLVGRLPLGASFNLLGKIGATYGNTDVTSRAGSGVASGSESGFGLSYGVGAEYVFNPQWSALLQYDAHDLKFVGSDRDRISATTLGVRFRF